MSKNKIVYDTMNSLVHERYGYEVIAIVAAEHWFKEFYDEGKIPYFIREGDYVVCSWYDFHDSEKSNIEGKLTIAICRNFEDAKILYDKYDMNKSISFDKKN